MIEVVCPSCGNALQVEERYAGHTGRCNRCNAPIRVPVPGETGAQSQYVAPESFGHYSKAKEERWEDPLDKAEDELELGEIPPEILEKHKALQLKRKRFIIKWASIAAAVVLLLAGVFLYVILRPDKHSETGKPAAQAVQPEALPTPPAAPPPPPIQPMNETVYAVESDWRYHRETCQIYISGVGAKHSGTVAQAVAAGYRPCEFCRPPEPAAPAPPPANAAPPNPGAFTPR